jgi:serine protease Do
VERMWITAALALSGCGALAVDEVRAEAPPTVARADLVSLADTLPDVAERSVRSVVSVATRRAPAAEGLGSGVIIREDGVVVTNHHVVAGATEVLVTLPDGSRHAADVLGTDPKTDLAVLRLQDPPAGLEPLPFGDSDSLRLGEVVLAVGTPFGVGQTVTMGIVSAKGRADVGIVDYEDFIQTDAAINPGNSGGALVDLRGTLVGINTAIFSRSGGSMGIGFAIPASMAVDVVEEILEDGTVDRGWLGVAIDDVEPGQRGVLVRAVQPGTPAERAGLRSGDVVLAFDGQPVSGASRFRNRVAAAGSDHEFEVVVLRDGQQQTLRGVLAALPPM